MPKKIEISHRTIIFVFLCLGAVWLLVQISSIILSLFVSLLLTTALNPVVERLTKFKIPRVLSILICYLFLIAFLGYAIAGVFPPLIEQTTILGEKLPSFLIQSSLWLTSLGIKGVTPEALYGQFSSQIGSLPGSMVGILISFFSNIISVFTVLVLTFYMLLERQKLNDYLAILFGEGQEKKAKVVLEKLEHRLGGWVRGELLLMTIIGLMTYIGLFLLGFPYALPLAIMAGILEVVPGIGPIISSIPAILVGLTISPVMAIAATALCFLIQQLENNLIVPNVMKRVAGVNPLITLISIAVGFKLVGVLGAILAVPIIIVLQVLMVEFFARDEFKILDESTPEGK
jgi:predicted PurR-regulated permease PerM